MQRLRELKRAHEGNAASKSTSRVLYNNGRPVCAHWLFHRLLNIHGIWIYAVFFLLWASKRTWQKLSRIKKEDIHVRQPGWCPLMCIHSFHLLLNVTIIASYCCFNWSLSLILMSKYNAIVKAVKWNKFEHVRYAYRLSYTESMLFVHMLAITICIVLY